MNEPLGRPVQRPSNDDGTVQPVVSSPGFVDKFPYLAEFLTKSRGDGQLPTTGTVTLFLEDGHFKLCLNDRPAARSTFVTGDTLGQVLDAADAALGSNTIKWRVRGYVRRPNRQKYFSQA